MNSELLLECLNAVETYEPFDCRRVLKEAALWNGCNECFECKKAVVAEIEKAIKKNGCAYCRGGHRLMDDSEIEEGEEYGLVVETRISNTGDVELAAWYESEDDYRVTWRDLNFCPVCGRDLRKEAK